MSITNKQKIKWEKNGLLILTPRQTEIIIGSLLGDGSLFKPYKATHNSYFQENHCLAQSAYVDFKASELGRLASSVKNVKKPSKNNTFRDNRIRRENPNRIVRMFTTIRHPFFTNLEKQWYKRDNIGNYVLNDKGERIKIIPNNLILTPLIVAVWYLDDGWHDPKRRRASLCTDGFTTKEVEFLCSKLIDDLNIKCNSYFHEEKPQIRIWPECYKYFIDTISNFVTVDCMKYKIDLSLYEPSTRIEKEVINNILRLRHKGLSYKEIATEVKLDYNCVYSVVYRQKNRSK